MQGLDWGGAKCAANFTDSDILSNLEDADEGFQSMVRPYREAIE